jgi:hypothetical protein
MSPTRPPLSLCCPAPRPNTSPSSCGRHSSQSAAARTCARPTSQHLSFVHSRLGPGRVTWQQQPRAEKGQRRRHDQPAAPAPLRGRRSYERVLRPGQLRTRRREPRSARQIDFSGPVGAAVQAGHHWRMPCGLQSLDVPRRPYSPVPVAFVHSVTTGPVGWATSRESEAILTTCLLPIQQMAETVLNPAAWPAQPAPLLPSLPTRRRRRRTSNAHLVTLVYAHRRAAETRDAIASGASLRSHPELTALTEGVDGWMV